MQEEIQKMTLIIQEEKEVKDKDDYTMFSGRKLVTCPYCSGILYDLVMNKWFSKWSDSEIEHMVLGKYQRYDYTPNGPTTLKRIKMYNTFINDVPIGDDQREKFSVFIGTLKSNLIFILSLLWIVYQDVGKILLIMKMSYKLIFGLPDLISGKILTPNSIFG